MFLPFSPAVPKQLSKHNLFPRDVRLPCLFLARFSSSVVFLLDVANVDQMWLLPACYEELARGFEPIRIRNILNESFLL